MDLAKLQKTLETAPARAKVLNEEIAAKRREAEALEFLLKAVRLLRTSWRDTDPGKYGRHWYAFKGNRKVWPRELIERSANDPMPAPESLCAFAELDAVNCPSCKRLAPLVCCYQQTEDGPFGDTWTKSFYALCVHCACLHQARPTQQSSRRF